MDKKPDTTEKLQQYVNSIIRNGGPNRVVINKHGDGYSHKRAYQIYGVTSDIIFIRNDGWSLGAPMSLVGVAEMMWKESWVAYIVKDEPGYTLYDGQVSPDILLPKKEVKIEHKSFCDEMYKMPEPPS